MDLVLVIFVASIAAALVLRRNDRRTWLIASACAFLVFTTWAARDFDGDQDLRASLPTQVRHSGFVTSATCQSCHPDEHDTWHRSYHRTMTQPVSPETMLGNFDDVVITDRGHSCRLFRRGDEYWVDMVDPLWFLVPPKNRPPKNRPPKEKLPAPPRIEVRVVMITGSHHLQTYWVRRPSTGQPYIRRDDGALVQLPVSWLVSENRWVPTVDTFLAPSSTAKMVPLPWNTSCNMCHSVGTRPRLSSDRFQTESVELGIACEACHGPGEDHVRAMRSPIRRYAKHFFPDENEETAADLKIVNPAKLGKERSAEVCGQCHSFNKELDMKRWADQGKAYRAGEELGKTKAVFKFTEDPTHPRLVSHLKDEPDALDGRFWKDGTIRVAGREFNGLIESKCYTHGEMTCLSCHSMHDYVEPKDQLAKDKLGDQSCLDCHGDLAEDIPAHTHHAKDSVGSSCMNCHMPHTTYGLLVAMRSHRIDSPNAKLAAESGRPNACNICHLDRTLEWTAKNLTTWYGHDSVELTEDQRKVAEGIRWSTKGDAPQRAVAAWAMGWDAALSVSGQKWQGAFLAATLDDDYSVIRQVAYNSLRKLGGYEGLRYDYVAPKAERQKRTMEALRTWNRLLAGKPDRHGPHLLLDSNGTLDYKTHERLVRERDNTPVRIIE